MRNKTRKIQTLPANIQTVPTLNTGPGHEKVLGVGRDVQPCTSEFLASDGDHASTAVFHGIARCNPAQQVAARWTTRGSLDAAKMKEMSAPISNQAKSDILC